MATTVSCLMVPWYDQDLESTSLLMVRCTQAIGKMTRWMAVDKYNLLAVLLMWESLSTTVFSEKGSICGQMGRILMGSLQTTGFYCYFLSYFINLQIFTCTKKARSLLCQHGWVTGCLSATRRYCIKMVKPILTLFQPSDSPSFSFLLTPCAVIRFQG